MTIRLSDLIIKRIIISFDQNINQATLNYLQLLLISPYYAQFYRRFYNFGARMQSKKFMILEHIVNECM